MMWIGPDLILCRRIGKPTLHFLNYFRNEGVPPDMIVDGSKEQTEGESKAECRQTDCQIRQIEPHSP